MKNATLAGAALVGLMATTSAANAAPVPGAGLANKAIASQSLVEKAHGWHRSCRPGRYGWHRHSWRFGRVPCGPVWDRPRRRMY